MSIKFELPSASEKNKIGARDETLCNMMGLQRHESVLKIVVPDHDGGRPMEVNACILITHMVYL
jgi:hypothetical protein